MQKRVLLSLAFSLLAAQGQALEFKEIGTLLFCSNPAASICGPKSEAAKAREDRLNKRVQTITDAAYYHAIEQLSKETGKNPIYFSREHVQKLDEKTKFRIYYTKLQTELNATRFIAEQLGIRSQYKQIRDLMVGAVNRVFQFKNNNALRDELIAEIKRVIIVDSAELEKRIQEKNVDAELLLSNYISTCGETGLADNAFALSSAVTFNKYLIACPGFMLRKHEEAVYATSDFQNLLQVLSHEWGHHIDARWYFPVFQNLANCLLNNHVQDLVDPAEVDPLRKIEFLTTSKAESNQRKIIGHLAEISADAWAVETVLENFRQSAVLTLPSQKLSLLRESFDYMCGTTDEGIHPTGEYRINTLLGRHPELRQMMGCEAVQPSCNMR